MGDSGHLLRAESLRDEDSLPVTRWDSIPIELRQEIGHVARQELDRLGLLCFVGRVALRLTHDGLRVRSGRSCSDARDRASDTRLLVAFSSRRGRGSCLLLRGARRRHACPAPSPRRRSPEARTRRRSSPAPSEVRRTPRRAPASSSAPDDLLHRRDEAARSIERHQKEGGVLVTGDGECLTHVADLIGLMTPAMRI